MASPYCSSSTLQRGVEVAGHAEPLGDVVRLVDPAGPRAADVELLQGDDVRLLRGDHPATRPTSSRRSPPMQRWTL